MKGCTCEFGSTCGGSGWLNCRARAWGNCFCLCGCTEDCYGCAECAAREYDADEVDDSRPMTGPEAGADG